MCLVCLTLHFFGVFFGINIISFNFLFGLNLIFRVIFVFRPTFLNKYVDDFDEY